MEKYKEIEQSIIKKYRKDIWSKFIKAVKEYELINENDKIMVCISGGKDSFLLAKCIEEIKRHGKVNFDYVFVCMNPGYNKKNHISIYSKDKFLKNDTEYILFIKDNKILVRSQIECNQDLGYVLFEIENTKEEDV